LIAIDKEFLDNEQSKVLEEEDKHVDDQMHARDDVLDDESKDLH